MSFGSKIQTARNQLGESQEEVTQHFNVSRQTISSWGWEKERSYPDIESIVKLSDYYQISLDHLLKEETKVMESIQEKERLARINRYFIVTMLVHIIACIGLGLSSYSHPWFTMAEGTRFVLIAITLINIVPLFASLTLMVEQAKRKN